MFKLVTVDTEIEIAIRRQALMPEAASEAHPAAMAVLFRARAHGMEGAVSTWVDAAEWAAFGERIEAFRRGELGSLQLHARTGEEVVVKLRRVDLDRAELCLELRPRDSIEEPFTNLLRVHVRPDAHTVAELGAWVRKHADPAYTRATGDGASSAGA